ncbi:hypothetical protein [Pasteurella atlantica]|uniref:hypothetical protein n=1 Tax=Pasteurellaceae TaxID=712 RepID=UPI00276140C5|nr:hypothetical protein [Pasteurella atlantica]MDP8098820.1 hypothetical protein [Pasteurella atlantica]MDP8106261.1 hypothetical protein [Pasteurella atlantica]MDP8115990.1 hypothetical protein [Pasteurella atlantica]
MKNINIFIKENVKKIGSSVYVVPDIPEKKLNNAINAMNCESFYESILAIQDSTIFGSAKEGFVFTGEKFIHHKYGEFLYKELQSATYQKDVTVNDKGKEKVDEYLLISRGDQTYKFENLYGIKYEIFATFLNKIVEQFDEDDFKEENQLKVLEDMPEDLKIAYLKIIINMTFIDDQHIDPKELAELFLLMARLKLSQDSRFSLRQYITELSMDNMVSVEDLIEIIKKNSEESHYKSLMISLAKDLINTHMSTKENNGKKFEFLVNYQNLFHLTDEEIELAYATVENDHKLLKEDLDDNAIEKNVKELAAKAGAAGVPLAAIYISGSVVGMSAAGITSGLATLGMGMGMTGGLVVVGLISIASYKGLKHLTGANEVDKYKTKELMLLEVIKQTQKTISLIIDDINYITEKLNDALLNNTNQSEKIKKLAQMIAQFQSAMKTVDQKGNLYQNSANRIHSPKVLDEPRLRELTEGATKKSLYEFIIVQYEKTENGFVLKKDINTDVLDKMGEIFKTIGYFDMTSIVGSKLSSFKKGLFK